MKHLETKFYEGTKYTPTPCSATCRRWKSGWGGRIGKLLILDLGIIVLCCFASKLVTIYIFFVGINKCLKRKYILQNLKIYSYSYLSFR